MSCLHCVMFSNIYEISLYQALMLCKSVSNQGKGRTAKGHSQGNPLHSAQFRILFKRDFALSLIALENLYLQPKISKKGQLVIGFNMLHRSFILSFLFFTLLHVSMAGRYIYELKRHFGNPSCFSN